MYAFSVPFYQCSQEEVQQNLKCSYCGGFISQPVTIIPCGHNYCLACKKGYGRECYRCGPKVRVEAMYRNELMDDIIGMVKTIQLLQSSFKAFTGGK